jgi:N-dimethylarginine dimethylaminohydrolase
MTKLLLCPTDHYSIEYEINPWMSRSRQVEPETGRAQWKHLCEILQEVGCHLEFIPPQPHLPDMVFTANAGLVSGNKFIRSNYRFPQRQGEAKHFERWFAEQGFGIVGLPEDVHFEGEGDALFYGDTLIAAYRFRSDLKSHQKLSEILDCDILSVHLSDEHFYHLDTCFCPLSGGGAIWFPSAFDLRSQEELEDLCEPLVEISSDEARQFGCNAICIGQEIILPKGTPNLCEQLTLLDYRTHPVSMTEFIKAGGACKCLVLFLTRESLSSYRAESDSAATTTELSSASAFK